MLAPGGRLLLVQSCVTGEQQTLDRLRAAGLTAGIAARAVVPFGPVMRARARMLRSRGLLADDAPGEEVLVVVGTAPAADELASPAPAAPLDRAHLRRAS